MATSYNESATSTLPLQKISHSPGAVNDMSPSPKPPAKAEQTTDHMAEDPANYLKGWPLHVVTVAFVANLLHFVKGTDPIWTGYAYLFSLRVLKCQLSALRYFLLQMIYKVSVGAVG